MLAVGNAVVAAFADRAPSVAARVWAGHPAVAVKLAMTAIGEAAAAGRPVAPAALATMAAAARRSPLAPEPFLVRGVAAQLAGDEQAAEQAFLAARRLEPRSPAARYFLAEQYQRTGRLGEALEETVVLARLVPAGDNGLAAFLAGFARSPGAVPQLRRLFASQPQLAPQVLATLADDPANAELVLALAGPPRRDPAAGSGEWQSRLVAGLVARGDYSRARRLWGRFAGVPDDMGDRLFNPGFGDSKAPPPFNWSLTASGAGLAEPAGKGELHLLFYGREDMVLAGQLLLLPPGRYRLTMTVRGDRTNAGALAWTVTCLPGRRVAASLPLDKAAAGLGFAVPRDGCAAQQLQLVGTAPEYPQPVDIVVAGLALSREP